jgi:hypothetical protein
VVYRGWGRSFRQPDLVKGGCNGFCLVCFITSLLQSLAAVRIVFVYLITPIIFTCPGLCSFSVRSLFCMLKRDPHMFTHSLQEASYIVCIPQSFNHFCQIHVALRENDHSVCLICEMKGMNWTGEEVTGDK